MALEINQVAAAGSVRPAKEMVEADFIKGGQGSVRSDVAADPRFEVVGPHDHGHGIPAEIAFDLALQVAVAGKAGLVPRWNGIDVRGVERSGNIEAIA